MTVNELLREIRLESSVSNIEVIAIPTNGSAVGVRSVSFGSFNGYPVLFLSLKEPT